MIINQNKQIFILILFFTLFHVTLTIDNKINDDEEEKLLFSWEHFRHGPRNPYTQINKTTWIDFIGVQWKNEGELSALGLRSHYLLGVATKKRYENFLSKSFDTNEIFIISSDVNRTIMSAMSNLQGIYRNYTTPNLTINQIDNAKIKGLNATYEQKINQKIEELKKSYIEDGISIMPIHLFSRVGLQFLLNGDNYCPGVIKFRNEIENQEEVKKIVKEFTDYTNATFGQYIFEFMNVSSEKTQDYLYINNNLNYICDTFIADYFHGIYMPHIIRTGMDMDKFYHHCLNYSIIDGYYISYGLPPTNLSYLTSSPVFRTIFNYMDRRIKYFEENNPDKVDPSSPKFVIYSGHDSTVAGIDVFLKSVFDIQYDKPEYTTSQLVELWHNKSGYFVKYLYNQKEKGTYELNYFKEKVNQNILPEDEINEICGVDDGKKVIDTIKKQNIFKKVFIIIIAMVIISFALLASVTILKKYDMKN